MSRLATRPGLAKVRALLVHERTVRLIRTQDARIHALLATADVMAEGRTIEERGRLVYYGSTSVALSAERAGVDVETLTLLARFDPHLRTRVVRLACVESMSRSGAPSEAIVAELDVLVREGLVVMVVDVSSVVRAARDRAAPR